MNKEIILTLDYNILELYYNYYFKQHPKAKKVPIDKPIHPSINTWMILKRPMMNALKQKWKDFSIFVVRHYGYENLMINNCELEVKSYFQTNRRHDIDNTVPKFILDGLSEVGFIVDDDARHITKLSMECFVDKENPRTELKFIIKENESEN